MAKLAKMIQAKAAEGPLRLLFICSRNQWRSPTGERVYRDRSGVQTRSAGTAKSARRRVCRADLRWADLILVMERKHQQRLRADFPGELRGKALVVLGIEDRFQPMDPELVARLRAAVDPVLAEIGAQG